MSPVHHSRPFNTCRMRLAQLLLDSVLVSVHIPAAAGPPHYKCDDVLVKLRVPLYSVVFLLLCSSVASFSPSFCYPSPLFLRPPFSPLWWGLNGVIYKLVNWCNIFTKLAREEQTLTTIGTGVLLLFSSSLTVTSLHRLFVHLSYSSTFYSSMHIF